VTARRLGRVFWIGAAAILVAAALVALVSVLRGEFSDTDGRILLTLGALLYTGGAALSGLALVDRGTQRALAWLVVAASPVCLGLVLWGVWSFAFDGGDEAAAKAAWSAVLALLAGLMASTALLLTHRRALVVLASAAGALAAVASTLTIVGVWAESGGDTFVKVVSALWILAALAYFLVPVLQRFTTAGAEDAVRVLGRLGDVELVATRRPLEGVAVEPPLRGERLLLRRRQTSSL